LVVAKNNTHTHVRRVNSHFLARSSLDTERWAVWHWRWVVCHWT